MRNISITHDLDGVCRCGWRSADIHNPVNYDAVTNNHVSSVIVRGKRNVRHRSDWSGADRTGLCFNVRKGGL